YNADASTAHFCLWKGEINTIVLSWISNTLLSNKRLPLPFLKTKTSKQSVLWTDGGRNSSSTSEQCRTLIRKSTPHSVLLNSMVSKADYFFCWFKHLTTWRISCVQANVDLKQNVLHKLNSPKPAGKGEARPFEALIIPNFS